MKFKPAQVWMHLFGCACFLALPFIMRPGTFSEWSFSDSRNLSDLFAYILLIAFFYLDYYLLIPHYYFTHKYLPYFSIILLCFLLITFLPDLIVPFKPMQIPGAVIEHREPPKDNFFFHKAGRHFFIYTAVFLFALLLKISTRWRLAEREKLNTELSYLRAQINPHFLFNTLNSIYSLAIDKSDETPNAVVKLSAMMRYLLNETSKNFVSLQNELDYIEDYISLQQLRFGKSMPLSFQIKGNADGKNIAPLILMSFVENAFKHGINAAEASEITIEITIENKEIVLFVLNNKVTMHITEAHSGVGIANTKKRLELLYPGRYTLTVTDDKKFFSVLLKLTLT